MMVMEDRNHSHRRRADLGQWLTAGIAAVVLSLATGAPLRSAQRLLPDSDDTMPPSTNGC